MNVRSSDILRMILIAAAFGVFGCSQDRGAGGANLLSPGSPTAQGTTSDANEVRVSLPFDPSHFTAPAANRFFPLVPGTVWSYVAETADGVETNEVEVTSATKTILGVATIVVHDRVYLEGSLTEDTFDWYAADDQGNVWYFGEDTRTVEDDVVVSTEGSWEAGQNGANPGIIMLAHPKVGDTYKQEDAPGVVEDMGKVLSLKETVTVPYGTFDGCLKTADWTPLEPGNRSFKYYAPGIGLVLEIERRDRVRVELTAISSK